MGKEQKTCSTKNKIVGAIASTAMIAVPFLTVPVAANEIGFHPYPEEVDKIQTIIVPQNGSKYIDLTALESFYGTSNLSIIQAENTNPNGITIAGFTGVNGIYQIKASANAVGKATFTVTGIRYSGESETPTNITDTFDVMVVANTGDADEFKYDITNALTAMMVFPEQYQTNDQVKGLLRNVSPKTVVENSPINYDGHNTAPFPIGNEERIHGFVGQGISKYSIRDSLRNYFSDADVRPVEGEYYEHDELDAIFVENENIRIEEDYEGYKLIPLQSGDFDLDVVVVDHHGGITKGKIPFHFENAEKFYLDDESTIKVDLRDYFPNAHEIANFYVQEGNSSFVNISDNEATFKPDTVPHTYTIVAAYMNDNTDYYTFSVIPKDSLHNISLLTSSELDLNLPSLLLPNPSPNVTYSVYSNTEHVNGLTYGIESSQDLIFEAVNDAMINSILDVTVTAKDLTNHITIKDNLQVKVVPYVFENYSQTVGIRTTELFNFGINKNEIEVTSPFALSGMFGSYSTVSAPANSGTGTVVITLNYKDEIIYKIPFTYPNQPSLD
ncbi:hypothetical protein GQF01_24340 [Paenibacillus sp. 5J-6]|uniref:Uncharacterized protein n=1 Tax=Paenibacillus silvestris TaxID=2606219 RepID=A0A6L8V7I1_9BACL|nr:hypothetical protein [Paenibacillus silvestris]MZQ85250.1 hypothetical protein [Paenibacillus silvestris]